MAHDRPDGDLFAQARGRTGHPYMVWDSIEAAPGLLGECLEGDPARQAKSVGERIRADGIERVYLFGCGTSYFAGTGIAYALNRWAGLDADSYNAFEFGRYRRLPADSRAMAVAVSHSGHTKVDVEAAEGAGRTGLAVVSLTDVKDSPLARVADMVVLGPGGRDPAVPKTRSYLAALLKGYMVAAAASNGAQLWRSLERIPAILEETRRELRGRLEELAGRLEEVGRIVLVGGGPCAQLASEIALKFVEISMMPAEGVEIEEAIHGPVLGLDPDTAVIALSVPGPSLDKVAAFARAARIVGCPVIEVAAGEPTGVEGVEAVPVTAGGIDECVAPLVLAYPLQALAYWTALARGVNPDVARTDMSTYRDAILTVMPPGTH